MSQSPFFKTAVGTPLPGDGAEGSSTSTRRRRAAGAEPVRPQAVPYAQEQASGPHSQQLCSRSGLLIASAILLLLVAIRWSTNVSHSPGGTGVGVQNFSDVHLDDDVLEVSSMVAQALKQLANCKSNLQSLLIQNHIWEESSAEHQSTEIIEKAPVSAEAVKAILDDAGSAVEAAMSAVKRQQHIAAAVQTDLGERLATTTEALLQLHSRAEADRLEAAQKLGEAGLQLEACRDTQAALAQAQAAVRQCDRGKEECARRVEAAVKQCKRGKEECERRVEAAGKSLEAAVKVERERGEAEVRARERAWEKAQKAHQQELQERAAELAAGAAKREGLEKLLESERARVTEKDRALIKRAEELQACKEASKAQAKQLEVSQRTERVLSEALEASQAQLAGHKEAPQKHLAALAELQASHLSLGQVRSLSCIQETPQGFQCKGRMLQVLALLSSWATSGLLVYLAHKRGQKKVGALLLEMTKLRSDVREARAKQQRAQRP
eukprot:jgi/Botrbrau1/16423/Bobra.0142s0022.1